MLKSIELILSSKGSMSEKVLNNNLGILNESLTLINPLRVPMSPLLGSLYHSINRLKLEHFDHLQFLLKRQLLNGLKLL